MQYDLIIWFSMFTLWWFTRGNSSTYLPTLILGSNFINLLLFNLPDGALYYYLEGVRHTVTIGLLYYLLMKEGYVIYYLSYLIVYLGIIILFLSGLFVALNNMDIDILGVPISLLELMVFIYGILFLKSDNSCLSDR